MMRKDMSQAAPVSGSPAGRVGNDICENIEFNISKPMLLLHSCCGPCSTSVIERLAPDYRICVYFYNPCITDNEEYELRKENQIKFIEEFNKEKKYDAAIMFVEGKYDPREYFDVAAEYAAEPEGGKRCTECFKLRLASTAEYAKVNGYDFFATTLTVSSHKNYRLISELGKQMEERYEIRFLDMDFKKKAGFQRSIELSKKHGLYRQNYCGCEYSKR